MGRGMNDGFEFMDTDKPSFQVPSAPNSLPGKTPPETHVISLPPPLLHPASLPSLPLAPLRPAPPAYAICSNASLTGPSWWGRSHPAATHPTRCRRRSWEVSQSCCGSSPKCAPAPELPIRSRHRTRCLAKGLVWAVRGSSQHSCKGLHGLPPPSRPIDRQGKAGSLFLFHFSNEHSVERECEAFE